MPRTLRSSLIAAILLGPCFACARALVVDAEITTLFMKESDGGYIVRDSVGEDASELAIAGQ